MGEVSEERPRIVLTVRAVIKQDGMVFGVKRSKNDKHNPGLWEFSGGKLDPGQTVEDALVRETLEETGYLVERRGHMLYVEGRVLTDRPGKYYGLPYVVLASLVVVVGGTHRLSAEHDDGAWFTYAEFMGLSLTPESQKAAILFEKEFV